MALPLIPSPVLLGALATLATGLTTGLGALPALLARQPSPRLLDSFLGFAAGVMLAAAAFSLLVPAIELAGPAVATGGLLAGAAVLALLDRIVPHLHAIIGREGPSSTLRRIWLFVLAITFTTCPKGWGSA